MAEKSKALVKAKNTPRPKKAIEKRAENLIEIAINKDYDLDRMQRLIEMKEKEDEKYAEKEFYIHFAELQADLQPIQRNKKGYTNNYSTLAAIKIAVDKKIADHGFSYYWERSKIDKEHKWMESAFVLVGYGHARRSVAEGPILVAAANRETGETRMNPLQAIQATQTYLRRYSMMDGLGIVSEDDDIDGSGKTAMKEPSKRTGENKNDDLEINKAALTALYKRCFSSKLFSDEELVKMTTEAKDAGDQQNIGKLKSLKAKWEGDLESKRKKGKAK